MASASPNKSADHLVEVLKQIQARKSVKPEDASKALQQYRKVQERIKELKSEIELFKANKEEREKEEALKKSQQQGKPGLGRRGTIRNQNDVSKPLNASSKVQSKSVDGLPQINGARHSRLPMRSSASVMTESPTRADNRNGKPLRSQQTVKSDDKTSSRTTSPTKEKDSSRLGAQNGQTKPIAEKREPNSVPESEETSRSGQQPERRHIPNTNNLVAEFNKIHEFEYRSAFHDLDKHYRVKEENITEFLAAIAKEAYTFCQTTSKQQFEDMTKAHAHVIDILVQPKYSSSVTKDVVVTYRSSDSPIMNSKTRSVLDKEAHQITRRFLKDYRKAMARIPVPGLLEIFEGVVQRDVITRYTSLRTIPKSTRPYMHRLLEINWYMSMHEPPMAQVWPRGGQLMNRDWFIPYNKKGATIIHTVWPALLYHKDGLLADRGICMVK
ncbi:hypothetical protein ACF0H5_011377 [Mactra antiquata]